MNSRIYSDPFVTRFNLPPAQAGVPEQLAKVLAGKIVGFKDLEPSGNGRKGMRYNSGGVPLFDQVTVGEDGYLVVAAADMGANSESGHLTAPAFGTAYDSLTQAYGRLLNPLYPTAEFTTGGSSSGSSVAISEGLADVVTSSDGGGSNRVPNASNGVMGHKSSRGLFAVPAGDWGGFAETTINAFDPADTAKYYDAFNDHARWNGFEYTYPELRPSADFRYAHYFDAEGHITANLPVQNIAVINGFLDNAEHTEANVNAINRGIKVLRENTHNVTDFREVTLPWEEKKKLIASAFVIKVSILTYRELREFEEKTGIAITLDDLDPTNQTVSLLGQGFDDEAGNELRRCDEILAEFTNDIEEMYAKYGIDMVMQPTLRNPVPLAPVPGSEGEFIPAIKEMTSNGTLDNVKEFIVDVLLDAGVANLTGRPSTTVPSTVERINHNGKSLHVPTSVMLTGNHLKDPEQLALAKLIMPLGYAAMLSTAKAHNRSVLAD
jgi:Asp-tRNA(Asn)/Glu-tRNA(Gln) amidotransferase A subunit family amidase